MLKKRESKTPIRVRFGMHTIARDGIPSRIFVIRPTDVYRKRMVPIAKSLQHLNQVLTTLFIDDVQAHVEEEDVLIEMALFEVFQRIE